MNALILHNEQDQDEQPQDAEQFLHPIPTPKAPHDPAYDDPPAEPRRMDAPQLGARIQLYLEKEGIWRFGEVARFDITTGEHVLTYEALEEEGLKEEENKRVNLLELPWRPAYAHTPHAQPPRARLGSPLLARTCACTS